MRVKKHVLRTLIQLNPGYMFKGVLLCFREVFQQCTGSTDLGFHVIPESEGRCVCNAEMTAQDF